MLINLDEIYTYEDILRAALRIHNNFPSLVSIFSIGKSHDNREIFAIKLGKGSSGPLISAGVHARERTNSIVIISIIEYYADKYYSGELDILKNYCIYFIPFVNPDGYAISTSGFRAINNRELKTKIKKINISSYDYKFNARGIDINRNFPSISTTTSKFSKQIMSENETKAFVNMCRSYKTLGLIDIHSRGRSIYYYRNAMDNDYNRYQFYIASKLSKITKYLINPPSEENPDKNSGGNTVNFYSEYIRKPALTIETVDSDAKFPIDVCYQTKVFNEIKEVPIEFLKLLVIPFDD